MKENQVIPAVSITLVVFFPLFTNKLNACNKLKACKKIGLKVERYSFLSEISLFSLDKDREAHTT